MSNIEPTPKPKPAANPDELANILDQLGQYTPSPSSQEPEEKAIKTSSTTPQQIQIEDQPSNELLEEAPSPSQPQAKLVQNFPQQQSLIRFPQPSSDQLNELIEATVEEKWQQVMERFGDLGMWKERTSRDIISIKQELIRTQDRFHQLQKAVLGKVAEYNDNISNVNSEMKALEKVFEKIIEPLTNNIKELQKITDKLKK